jgi:hypothetical protein
VDTGLGRGYIGWMPRGWLLGATTFFFFVCERYGEIELFVPSAGGNTVDDCGANTQCV